MLSRIHASPKTACKPPRCISGLALVLQGKPFSREGRLTEQEAASSAKEDGERCVEPKVKVRVVEGLMSDSDVVGRGGALGPVALSIAVDAAADAAHDSSPPASSSSPPTSHPSAVISTTCRKRTASAAACASSSEPSPLPSSALLLNEEDLQRQCYRFLQWLTQPPMTQIEALVKTRCVNSIAQLQPIRLNLRFLFALLQQSCTVSGVDLDLFQRLPVCQALYKRLTEREVGSGRIHALFLLLKKVLVFLTSERSTKERQYIQPSSVESFFYVDGVCCESSQRRKQESRNRILLGVHGSQRARQGKPHPRALFQVPTTWSSSSSSSASTTSEEQEWKRELGREWREPSEDTAMAIGEEREENLAGAEQAGGRVLPDSNERSPAELKIVAQKCLHALKEAAAAEVGDATVAVPRARDLAFVNFLVTATLCLAMAPRSQVLKELRLGQTFEKETDGRYWIKMPAELNKNAKPTLFALPIELTTPYDLYIERIRPRLLQASSSAGAAERAQLPLLQAQRLRPAP